MLQHSYLRLAILSGMFASLASVFSKLTFGDTSLASICAKLTTVTSVVWSSTDCALVAWLDVPWRVFMLLCVVACNVIMWLAFSKAMASSPTTVEVTVVNTASNFLMSAWFGMFFFGETFTVTWYAGLSLIIIGLAVIHKSTASDNADHVTTTAKTK